MPRTPPAPEGSRGTVVWGEGTFDAFPSYTTSTGEPTGVDKYKVVRSRSMVVGSLSGGERRFSAFEAVGKVGNIGLEREEAGLFDPSYSCGGPSYVPYDSANIATPEEEEEEETRGRSNSSRVLWISTLDEGALQVIQGLPGGEGHRWDPRRESEEGRFGWNLVLTRARL